VRHGACYELCHEHPIIMGRRGRDASLRRGNPTEFLLSGLVRCDHWLVERISFDFGSRSPKFEESGDEVACTGC
jgi:hypothetical protein